MYWKNIWQNIAFKTIVSTVPKNRFGKLFFKSEQEYTAKWKTNSLAVICALFLRLSAKLIIFVHLWTEFIHSYVLAFFKILVLWCYSYLLRQNKTIILRSECVNTCGFWLSLGKELKAMAVLPLKNIFYSTITHMISKISSSHYQHYQQLSSHLNDVSSNK